MKTTDRRNRVALDQAYEFYRQTLSDGSGSDLHTLANSLKTVTRALDAAQSGDMQLTYRLWLKIRQALFDKLLTSYSCHVVAITADGRALLEREPLPDECRLELYPEGLKRADDVFHTEIRELHPHTRARLNQVWRERGPSLRKEDFDLDNQPQCEDGVCAMRPNSFIVGHEVLLAEASTGRQKAYQAYWRLYWQSYCSPKPTEKQTLHRQMANLEAVWGNLNY